MHIRKATTADMAEIMRIYATARKFMAQNGNPTQWADGYPKQELLESDIEKECLYVCETSQGINAVFYTAGGIDPTYINIYGGKWLNDNPYGVIHRIASDGSQRGVLKFCIEYCKQFYRDIKIDTHEDNKIMQHLLEKNGFCRCGIIHLENGDERIAYHYTSNGETNEKTT